MGSASERLAAWPRICAKSSAQLNLALLLLAPSSSLSIHYHELAVSSDHNNQPSTTLAGVGKVARAFPIQVTTYLVGNCAQRETTLASEESISFPGCDLLQSAGTPRQAIFMAFLPGAAMVQYMGYIRLKMIE